MMKAIARKVLVQLRLYSLYSLKKAGPLYEDGWFKSFEEKKCIDLKGNPLPWLTYPAIDFLVKRVHPEMFVFEYGCGWGTLWWASRVKNVICCEHNQQWYEDFTAKIPPNVDLYHIDLEYGGRYSQKVAQYRQLFDIVVIDGRDRVNCAINSIQSLKTRGVIIWDNSDRAEYKKGIDFLYDNGFRSISFSGMSPIVNFKTETSIFYRDNNCLRI